MKKIAKIPHKFASISDLHRTIGLPAPLHPLVSIFDNTQIKVSKRNLPKAFIFDFYNISYKKKIKGRTGYGQNHYDFDDGTLIFTTPNQVIASSDDKEYFGISFLFHPDFIRNYPLAKNIKHYGFFSYESNEALHLSEKEKAIILNIFKTIEDELNNSIDDFSQDIVIAHLDTLLNYSNRFYKRQFITRKAVNHDLIAQMEQFLNDYFEREDSLKNGLPTVKHLASALNISPRYLSDMLRSYTGQNAQQHIHNKIIEKAKEYLTTSNLSVAEIAYQLGFEHPQSLNRLFKKKNHLTPFEFKQSFN